MNEKSILNNGIGSPGETTRLMTKEFLKLKSNQEYNNLEICKKILKARALTYTMMGFNILDDTIIEKIIIKSKGELPFAILADIFVTNKVQGINYVGALFQNLDIVIEVVIENYNALVLPSDKVMNNSAFKFRTKEFMELNLD